jgi:hypothetical protein
MSRQKHFSTMAAAVVPRSPWCHPACTKHATTNQDHRHRPSFLSGEAWQVALGCRYGSQRTPWWGGCTQDDLASNLRSKGKKIALSPIFISPIFWYSELVWGEKGIPAEFFKKRVPARSSRCSLQSLWYKIPTEKYWYWVYLIPVK